MQVNNTNVLIECACGRRGVCVIWTRRKWRRYMRVFTSACIACACVCVCVYRLYCVPTIDKTHSPKIQDKANINIYNKQWSIRPSRPNVRHVRGSHQILSATCGNFWNNSIWLWNANVAFALLSAPPPHRHRNNNNNQSVYRKVIKRNATLLRPLSPATYLTGAPQALSWG